MNVCELFLYVYPVESQSTLRVSSWLFGAVDILKGWRSKYTNHGDSRDISKDTESNFREWLHFWVTPMKSDRWRIHPQEISPQMSQLYFSHAKVLLCAGPREEPHVTSLFWKTNSVGECLVNFWFWHHKLMSWKLGMKKLGDVFGTSKPSGACFMTGH